MNNIKSHNRVKTLFCISLILLFAAENLFSQANQNQTENTATVQPVNSSFENDTNYFADNSNGSDSGNAASTYKAPSTARLIIRMIVVLVLVVAALYGLMWFFKKKNNPAQSDDDFLRRVSSLTLSPGKSVEIVTLVDRGFILGVTDSNINLIAEITDKEMISALNLNFDKKQNTKKPMNFSDVLDMFMPGNARNRSNIYSNTEQAVENLSRNSVNEETEPSDGNNR